MFSLFRRLRARIRYRHFDDDLMEEIEFHRAMKERELAADDATGARTASMRAMGNMTLTREDARAVWIARWLEHGWQDVRYAARGMARQPGFALAAIGILAVSTGLLTTLVVFADAALLQPWRVPEPERVRLVRPATRTADGFAGMRVPEYFAVRDGLALWQSLSLTLRVAEEDLTFDNGATDRVESLCVTANYFHTLGLQLTLGRTFTPDEDSFESPARVAVISHRLWRTHLASDPGVVGRQVRLGPDSYTIVGVTPGGFIDGHGSRTEIWTPFSTWLGSGTVEGRRAYLDPRHQSGLQNVVGRLAHGVSDRAAAAELSARSKAFRAEANLEISGIALQDTRPISRSGNRDVVTVMGMVAAALLLVQLLACANVGNLLLARALARQREIAVRLALGAGRSRIIRQLLAESGLLIVISTALGLFIARALLWIAVLMVPDLDERPEFFGPGLATFVALACLAGLSTLVAGLAPAIRATRTSLFALAGHRQGQTRQGIRLQQGLLATQIVLATILLSAASLLTQAVRHALASDPGFRVEQFQEVTFTLSGGFDRDRQVAFNRELYGLLQSGWPPIAFADWRPIDDTPMSLTLRIPEGDSTRLESVLLRPVSANYFDVLGIRLLAGRMTEPGSSGREIVLNRRAADLLWPGESPLGRTVSIGSRADNVTTPVVVGLAPDLPGRTIVDRRPIAYRASNFVRPLLIIRSQDPRIAERVGELASRIEPGVVTTARPMAESVAETMLPARIGGWVAWGIGALALVLATVGAFGVFAYAVEARRREVGIRMALGARASEVVWHVLRSTQAPVLVGALVGVGVAAAGAPLLGAHLYGLSPFEPVAYVQVAAILAAASALATWLPARRATRVNPAEVLRAE